MRAAKQKQFQDVTTKPTTDKQTNNLPTVLFETQYFPLEKKLVRSENRTFNIADIFVASRLSWTGKHRSLISL